MALVRRDVGREEWCRRMHPQRLVDYALEVGEFGEVGVVEEAVFSDEDVDVGSSPS